MISLFRAATVAISLGGLVVGFSSCTAPEQSSTATSYEAMGGKPVPLDHGALAAHPAAGLAFHVLDRASRVSKLYWRNTAGEVTLCETGGAVVADMEFRRDGKGLGVIEGDFERIYLATYDADGERVGRWPVNRDVIRLQFGEQGAIGILCGKRGRVRQIHFTELPDAKAEELHYLQTSEVPWPRAAWLSGANSLVGIRDEHTVVTSSLDGATVSEVDLPEDVDGVWLVALPDNSQRTVVAWHRPPQSKSGRVGSECSQSR